MNECVLHVKKCECSCVCMCAWTCVCLCVCLYLREGLYAEVSERQVTVFCLLTFICICHIPSVLFCLHSSSLPFFSPLSQILLQQPPLQFPPAIYNSIPPFFLSVLSPPFPLYSTHPAPSPISPLYSLPPYNIPACKRLCSRRTAIRDQPQYSCI